MEAQATVADDRAFGRDDRCHLALFRIRAGDSGQQLHRDWRGAARDTSAEAPGSTARRVIHAFT